MVTAHSRGHPIRWDAEREAWVYADDGSPATEERPCVKCGEMPTPEGYDACLGDVPGATSACCGHGVEDGYAVYEGCNHRAMVGTMARRH